MLRIDSDSGEVVELAAYAAAFSARARQIETDVDSYEAQWRSEHPGEEPGPTLRQAWDRRAWADARPDKVVPVTGADLERRWVDEIHELGFQKPAPRRGAPPAVAVGSLDRAALASVALLRLGAQCSAWNQADARGEVEHLLGAAPAMCDARWPKT
ncbi:relaxase domain-containing protein [Nocardioides daphniae]|nr:relaxase domain-containing protein [Nocardioides daphniae]